MGTGYTRNDGSNNIADGNVINASDLDGEFDAVQAAFNGSSGHSHDGTTGEGPTIAAAGLASNAVTTVKILDGNVTSAKLDTNIAISGTLGVTGVLTGSSLDISGDIDVDGTTNLDVVDIDGAVDMASTLVVATSTTTPFISLGSTGNSYQTVTGSANGNDLTYRSYQSHIFKNTTGASSSTDGTDVMKIDASGYVTQSKLPMFNINGSGFTINATGQAAITSSNGFASSTEYDPDGLFNHTNGRFTAPVAGRYFFIFSIGITFNSGYHYSYLFKNGSNVVNRNVPQSSFIETVSIQQVINLAAGDYVTAERNNNNQNGVVNDAMFCGFLLG